ncbi:hypothetical protein GWR56_06450 [Mucilaginibacter sp. 14171R-50]|uniref:hypothetical protein n=1 Tax=Mucilaginibacter sp. 14171R-50 TaxID=2703789 RepID=UPI00138C89F8|nr:hypothetical protein [Mucilaginibacter sp. 14171R-50]QHS55196.1 hypothetical protein GWR56_06450 [Mucilaginibacter sp. 14171R-50]
MKNRVIKINTKGDQWKIQQLFGELAGRLDRLPDADEVRRNPLRSAPAGITEMVF